MPSPGKRIPTISTLFLGPSEGSKVHVHSSRQGLTIVDNVRMYGSLSVPVL